MVSSPLVDATNLQDDHPSLVVGVLLVPSQVAQILLNPIHVEAGGPIHLVEVDPSHLAEGGLLGPILLAVLVAISLEVEDPSRRVPVGLLVAEDPIHLVVEVPSLVGLCRKADRLRLAVPLWVDSVLVPSCFHGSCEEQTAD